MYSRVFQKTYFFKSYNSFWTRAAKWWKDTPKKVLNLKTHKQKTPALLSFTLWLQRGNRPKMRFGHNFWLGVLLTQGQGVITAFCSIFSGIHHQIPYLAYLTVFRRLFGRNGLNVTLQCEFTVPNLGASWSHFLAAPLAICFACIML